MVDFSDEEQAMAEKSQKTTPVRLTDDAILWARRASGFTNESMAQYVSRIVVERGREDVTRLYAEIADADEARAMATIKPKRSKKP